MKIRLIDDPKFAVMDGANQMALDDAIFKEYEASEKPEFPVTLRFYSFNPSCVTFGYFQKAATLNMNYIKERGFSSMRRITGGRAVLHHRDLTYSVIVHKSSGFFFESVLENYRHVAEALLDGFKSLSIEGELHPSVRGEGNKSGGAICFDSPSFLEVKVNGKKFCGSAQNKVGNCFLQHGTVYFEMDPKLHYLCMTPPETLKFMDDDMVAMFSDKLKDSACSIADVENIAEKPDFGKLASAITAGFTRVFGAEAISSPVTADEMKAYDDLMKTRYGTPRWNTLR